MLNLLDKIIFGILKGLFYVFTISFLLISLYLIYHNLSNLSSVNLPQSIINTLKKLPRLNSLKLFPFSQI